MQGAGRGSEFLGTVSVVNSPPATRWTLNVNGNDVAGLYGTSSYGPIVWAGTLPLTIRSTGPTLVDGTTYRAVIVGNEYAGGAPPTVPTPAAMSVTTLSGQVTAKITGPVTVTGTVDLGVTTKVDIGTVTGTVTVTGDVVASGTVDIGNTPAVTVSSGTVDVGNITSGTVNVDQVTTIAGAKTVQIINKATTILATGDQLVDLGHGYVNKTGNIARRYYYHAAYSYSALAVRAWRTNSSYPLPVCVTVSTTQTATGGATLGSWIAPLGPTPTTSGTAVRAVVAFGNLVGHMIVATFHYTTGTSQTTAVTISVQGMTSNPGVPMRSDGRTYPIGSRVGTTYLTGPGTSTIVAAPTSPLRILLKSMWAQAPGLAYVRGTINGTAVNLMYSGAGTVGGTSPTPCGDSGLLLDAGTRLYMDNTSGATKTARASATYDLVP